MHRLRHTMLTVVELKIRKGIIHFFKKLTIRNREKCKQLYYNRRGAVVKASFEGYNEAEGELDRKGDS